MKKININPKILFLVTIIIFIAIIGFFTAIYPLTGDELRLSHDTWDMVLKQMKKTFIRDTPRLLVSFHIIFLHFPHIWQTIFNIINPFVQLFSIFALFFIITGRKVDLKSTKDFSAFLLLCLMYLLLTPRISNTVFWISGAMSYSWGFVPILILFCLFRKTIDGKTLNNSNLSKGLMALCGLAAGLSPENAGPIIWGLTVLFLIYCKYKKIKIPSFYYFALAGVSVGVGAMLLSGANGARFNNNPLYTVWHNLPLNEKIFVFLNHFNTFLNSMFWIPVLNLIGLLFILYDKKNLMLKNKEFIISSLLCLCGFASSLVLFVAPYVSLRAHYPSAIFFFISFTLMLFLFQEIYRFNFIKYITLALLIVGIVFAPLITIPYLTLHRSEVYREQTIKDAVKRNKEIALVNRLTVLKAPTENWTIEYYDILWPTVGPLLYKKYKIQLKFEIPQKFFFYAKPI